MTKSRKIILDCPGDQCHHMSPYERETGGSESEKRCYKVGVMLFKDGEGFQDPRNTGGLQKLEKAREQIVP